MNPRRIVKTLIPRKLFEVVEPYGHMGETAAMQIRHGFPARGMKVIGVTGTDGKTTTSVLIHHMLNHAGYRTGLLTTVAHGVDKLTINETHMTVTNANLLLARIKAMRSQQPEYLVMEITSHALAQNRAWGIPFDMAVLTNMSPEHLDFHKTFERYKEAKLKLFRLAAANKSGRRLGIVNADDAVGAEFAAVVPHSLSYGIDSGEVRASKITSRGDGSRYTLTYGGRTLTMSTQLPARFNVYNTLAAAAVGMQLGLSDEQIEQGIATLPAVPGRMNRVDAGQSFNLFIDFAHTPAAFTNVFGELRKLTKGRLIAVFGATGNRDRTKRPLMAEVAANNCDLVVLTQDDDGTEDGLEIIQTLEKAAVAAGKKRNHDLWSIHDRAAAIDKAVSLAKPGDTVVLLGIGHQTTLNTNAGEVPWSEVQVATEAIKKYL